MKFPMISRLLIINCMYGTGRSTVILPMRSFAANGFPRVLAIEIIWGTIKVLSN
jgi:hypothetical protein